MKSGAALAKPLRGVCKRGVRSQNTGVRIIVHLAREKVTILDTALAKPTKSVRQAPKEVE